MNDYNGTNSVKKGRQEALVNSGKKTKGKSNFSPQKDQKDRQPGKKINLLGSKFNDASSKIDKGSYNLMDTEHSAGHSGVISGVSYKRNRNVAQDSYLASSMLTEDRIREETHENQTLNTFDPHLGDEFLKHTK